MSNMFSLACSAGRTIDGWANQLSDRRRFVDRVRVFVPQSRLSRDGAEREEGMHVSKQADLLARPHSLCHIS